MRVDAEECLRFPVGKEYRYGGRKVLCLPGFGMPAENEVEKIDRCKGVGAAETRPFEPFLNL